MDIDLMETHLRTKVTQQQVFVLVELERKNAERINSFFCEVFRL